MSISMLCTTGCREGGSSAVGGLMARCSDTNVLADGAASLFMNTQMTTWCLGASTTPQELQAVCNPACGGCAALPPAEESCFCDNHSRLPDPQASDLKLSIRGSATVKPEVAENEDGTLAVSYMAPMSGEYKVGHSQGSANHAASVPSAPTFGRLHGGTCRVRVLAMCRALMLPSAAQYTCHIPAYILTRNPQVTMSIGPSAVGGSPFRVPLSAAAAERCGILGGPAQRPWLCGRGVHRNRHCARPVWPQVSRGRQVWHWIRSAPACGA